jgi:KaiC/GvpD/RAD55 family RecA-like ATPase
VKARTGVTRLDDLLGGGIPVGSATLVYGPPFIGKEVMARRAILAGLEDGVPALLVLANATAADTLHAFAAMDAKFEDYTGKGLVRVVDAYSRAVGADDPMEGVTYVDNAVDLNAVSVAVNDAQRAFIRDHDQHRALIDSVSTLMAYTNPQTTFRFLQVLLGKMKRAGATTFLLMDAGMHSDTDVQMMKHVTQGVLEVKTENDRTLARVEGLGVTANPGWVAYRFTDTDVDLTGSFTAGRIR